MSTDLSKSAIKIINEKTETVTITVEDKISIDKF
jgi:hypothetical protein